MNFYLWFLNIISKVDDNGKIVDAKFKTFGCGSAIASSSLATEMMIGKTVDEAQAIKNTDIAQVRIFGLRNNYVMVNFQELSLPPVKLHCSVLAEDAIKAAVRDIAKKNEATA